MRRIDLKQPTPCFAMMPPIHMIKILPVKTFRSWGKRFYFTHRNWLTFRQNLPLIPRTKGCLEEQNDWSGSKLKTAVFANKPVEFCNKGIHNLPSQWNQWNHIIKNNWIYCWFISFLCCIILLYIIDKKKLYYMFVSILYYKFRYKQYTYN